MSIFGKVQEYSGMIKYGSAMQMVTGFTIGTAEDLSKKYSEFEWNFGSPSRIWTEVGGTRILHDGPLH